MQEPDTNFPAYKNIKTYNFVNLTSLPMLKLQQASYCPFALSSFYDEVITLSLLLELLYLLSFESLL